MSPATIDTSLDFEWHHRINLEIIPNPELEGARQRAIAEEYGMTEGLLVVPCRLSAAFYLMTANNLDVEPGKLAPEKQQLVLRNRPDVEAARAATRRMSIQALERSLSAP